ncbi:hypothetical protein A3F06_03300 [candidate division TM6 bacterium RIFCSPHIGHO2_12_FULL_36_22]|nr:MAG: hypothetical protein A3F06_03300 [candidate division TM6 bacterium RIFCSPHIGHO2_12_FULL_36_22]
MGFFERIGNGFSIGFFSIFYPFKHPRLYVYTLIQAIIMGMTLAFVGMTTITQRLLLTSPNNLFLLGVYVVGYTLGSIVFVGLVRTAVGGYQGKSYGFFQAMELTGKQWFYIFLFTLLNILVNQLPMPTLALVYIPLIFLFSIVSCFFIPVVVFEPTGFFNIIGRSLRYFGRGIIEVIVSLIVAFILMGLLFGTFAFSLISLVGIEQIQLAARGSITWLSLFMPVMWLIVIFGIILWIFGTGLATITPTMYDYLTHDRKNPLN